MKNPDTPPELHRKQDAAGRFHLVHDWPTDAPSGRALQTALSRYVSTEDTLLPERIDTVAGVDIGFEDSGQTTRAAVVVLDAGQLTPVEQLVVRRPTRMPYIPGLLSFRETPVALEALQALSALPDLLMVDGHGIAHPRRVGVASHLGLVSGLPTIGIAKKRLTGSHDPVPEERFSWVELTDRGQLIGAVMRSRTHVKPIFISSGHGIGLGTSIEWTRHTLTRYRLPETTRAADKLASRR